MTLDPVLSLDLFAGAWALLCIVAGVLAIDTLLTTQGDAQSR